MNSVIFKVPFLPQVSEIEVRVDGDDESLLLPLTVGLFLLLPLTECPCPRFGPVRRGSFNSMYTFAVQFESYVSMGYGIGL